MAVDVLFYVVHTAVAYFNCVTVEDLVKRLAFWKFFVKDV